MEGDLVDAVAEAVMRTRLRREAVGEARQLLHLGGADAAPGLVQAIPGPIRSKSRYSRLQHRIGREGVIISQGWDLVRDLIGRIAGTNHDRALRTLSEHDTTSAPLPRPGGLAARAAAAPAAGYLAGLNPEQRLVEATDGPVLVLAGAGTGKTRVLTTRIAHLLATNRAFPSQILAVTFTNKAAREMKERIAHLVGGAVEGMPWLGTFHSIGVKLLRRHAELLGLRSDFTILDTDDQIRLIKQVIQAEGLDDKRWPAKHARLDRHWKNKGLAPRYSRGRRRAFANGKGGALYHAYQERLKTLNACDFGDLLLHPITLFRDNPDVLATITSVSATSWSTSIRTPTRPSICGCGCSPSGREQNVCCVGDDDQSIYGWRGAEVDNILRFEQDFPGAKVVRLERNYRSTGHILGAAAQADRPQ
jgi:DNA helicase-2/ATP-dependent DNA helicase PcrA